MKKNIVPTIGKYLRQSGPMFCSAQAAQHLDEDLEHVAQREAGVGHEAARCAAARRPRTSTPERSSSAAANSEDQITHGTCRSLPRACGRCSLRPSSSRFGRLRASHGFHAFPARARPRRARARRGRARAARATRRSTTPGTTSERPIRSPTGCAPAASAAADPDHEQAEAQRVEARSSHRRRGSDPRTRAAPAGAGRGSSRPRAARRSPGSARTPATPATTSRRSRPRRQREVQAFDGLRGSWTRRSLGVSSRCCSRASNCLQLATQAKQSQDEGRRSRARCRGTGR